MTQEPQLEVEVQGRAGEPVALPLANDADAAYRWTLDVPDGVETVGETAGTEPGTEPDAGAGSPAGPAGRLLVRADQPGSHVLTATLADGSGAAPMTVLLVRLTVA